MQKVKAIMLVGVIIAVIALTIGCVDKEPEEMNETKTAIVYVNTHDIAFNQYGALGAAFDLKANKKVENVIVFYGPGGIEMTKKGSLAKYELTPAIKETIANQYDGLNPEDLPDNLELLARFLNSDLGVKFYCCGTFNCVMEDVTTIEEVKDVEDFITPLKIPAALGAYMSADVVIPM